MAQATEAEHEAYLRSRYGIGSAALDKVAARLLWCMNRADPSPDDVEWENADEFTRHWCRTRVKEVLDEYLPLAGLKMPQSQ